MISHFPVTLNLGFFSNITATRQLAEEWNLGLEIQHFTDPQTLDTNCREKLGEIKTGLHGFKGMLSLHGPYVNLEVGSHDAQILGVTRGRIQQGLQIADALGARIMVLHTNYAPTLKHHGGVPPWAERRIPFWGEIARSAEKFGVTVVMENVYEPDPLAQTTVLDAIKSPALKACLDTGHANMTGTTALKNWIAGLGERLIYVHMHNNSGASDDHWALEKGTLNVQETAQTLAALKTPPRVCLELRSLEDQRNSFRYLQNCLAR